MSRRGGGKYIGKEGKGRGGYPAFSFSEGMAALKADPVLERLRHIASHRNERLYLVGGVARNVSLGVPPPKDYDFALAGDAAAFSADAARAFGGTSFALDEETSSYRVVSLRDGAVSLTLDVSPVHGSGIDADLAQRDFTVDAIGVDVEALLGAGAQAVIDPCGGLRDAAAKVIRMTSAAAFEQDPLRTVRAVRLSQQYGLEITGDTAQAVKAHAGMLSRVSAERIRDELILIFSSPGTAGAVSKLHELGCAGVFLPETSGWGDVQGYDLMAHSLKVVERAEEITENPDEDAFPGFSRNIRRHLAGSTGAVGKKAFLKLAAFLHDAGKAVSISQADGLTRFIGHDREGALIVDSALKRLKFSRRTVNEMCALIRSHHRVFTLAKLAHPSDRAKAHLFRSVEGDYGKGLGVDMLLLSLADARATRGGEDPVLYRLVVELLGFYYDVYTRKKQRPLLGGADVMRIFGVKQGPAVGEIIKKVSEGVETGAVKSRKGAVEYVRKWLEGKGG